MVDFGTEKSELQVKQFPGLFGTEEGAGVGNQLQDIFGGGQGAVGSQLINELLNPTFGPTTSSEQSLIDSIINQTQGQTAVRGLGPATQGGLARAIAPELINQRQNRIGNLLGGTQAGLQQRGQDISGLLELAGLVMPQLIGGQKSSGFNFGIANNPTKTPVG